MWLRRSETDVQSSATTPSGEQASETSKTLLWMLQWSGDEPPPAPVVQ